MNDRKPTATPEPNPPESIRAIGVSDIAGEAPEEFLRMARENSDAAELAMAERTATRTARD